jgi:hypothetical protein
LLTSITKAVWFVPGPCLLVTKLAAGCLSWQVMLVTVCEETSLLDDVFHSNTGGLPLHEPSPASPAARMELLTAVAVVAFKLSVHTCEKFE